MSFRSTTRTYRTFAGLSAASSSTDPTLTNANYHRHYQGWGGMTIVNDEANSHYEWLQATLRATAFHGLSADLAYTYSHTWDLIDAQLFANVDNPYNPRYQYGTSGFDRRQMAVVNFDYDMPFFEHPAQLQETCWVDGPSPVWDQCRPAIRSASVPHNTTGLSLTDHPNLGAGHLRAHLYTLVRSQVFSEPAPCSSETRARAR